LNAHLFVFQLSQSEIHNMRTALFVACSLACVSAKSAGRKKISKCRVRDWTEPTGPVVPIRTGTCEENRYSPIAGNTSYFIGNENIELGISPWGDFGTACSKPSDWHSNRSGIGMTSSYNGLESGNPNVGFFLPGNPEERFGVGFRRGSATSEDIGGGSNCMLNSHYDIQISSLGFEGTDSVALRGTVDGVQLDMKYTLSPGDKHYMTYVTVKNINTTTQYDVRFHRSFDPDNTVDAGGSYTTDNKIVSTMYNGTGDTMTIVAATSRENDEYHNITGKRATIFFLTMDDRARVYTGNFANHEDLSYEDPEVFEKPQAKGYFRTADKAIQITFGLGDLAPGQSTSFQYATVLQYVDTLDEIEFIAASTPC